MTKPYKTTLPFKGQETTYLQNLPNAAIIQNETVVTSFTLCCWNISWTGHSETELIIETGSTKITGTLK